MITVLYVFILSLVFQSVSSITTLETWLKAQAKAGKAYQWGNKAKKIVESKVLGYNNLIGIEYEMKKQYHGTMTSATVEIKAYRTRFTNGLPNKYLFRIPQDKAAVRIYKKKYDNFDQQINSKKTAVTRDEWSKLYDFQHTWTKLDNVHVPGSTAIWEVETKDNPEMHAQWIAPGKYMEITKILPGGTQMSGSILMDIIVGLAVQWGVATIRAEDDATYWVKDATNNQWYSTPAMLYRSVRNQQQPLGAGVRATTTLIPSMYMKWGFVFDDDYDLTKCTTLATIFNTKTFNDLDRNTKGIITGSGVAGLTAPASTMKVNAILSALYAAKHIKDFNEVTDSLKPQRDYRLLEDMAFNTMNNGMTLNFVNARNTLGLYTAHQNLYNKYDDNQYDDQDTFMKGYEAGLRAIRKKRMKKKRIHKKHH
eukprot:308517_1